MFLPVTVLQVSARLLYSVHVYATWSTGVFLSSVGKCRTAKVNKLTSNFLWNWRNPRRKIFNYWLRLTVKIASLVHACFNGTNDFRNTGNAWKMMIGHTVHAQIYRWELWKGGYPVARRQISSTTLKSWGNRVNVWEGNDRSYGETGGFCTRTTHQSTTHYLWSNF